MSSPLPFHGSSAVDARGGTFTEVHRDQIVNYFQNDKMGLHKLLSPVHEAEYTRSENVARCLPCTREGVINEIKQSIDSNTGNARICWLKGPAGSGKSAISQTIAEWYAGKNGLLASFFFLRGAGNRSNITRFIPSLIYQLSLSIPKTKPLIERAIQNEPSIFQSSFQHQLRKLLVEPILAVRNPILATLMRKKSLLIVIDALDECDDKDPIAEFIQSVADIFQENHRLPIRILYTSRIEEHLRKKLEAPIVYPLNLEDFDAHVDIRTFFRSRFSIILQENQAMRSIALPWPSDADLDALVRKSEGSFIFANTLVNFVDDGTDLPHRKLQTALTVDAGLDVLYSQVLSAASHTKNVERVIGTIMLLNEVLPITSLARLLQLESADIIQALLGLQSILLIPSDDDQPVRLFHTSLRDFLTVQPRSGAFFVDPPPRHLCIVINCLKAVMIPPENVIFYDKEQKYAALNWCDHFLRGLTIGGDHLLRSQLGASFMSSIVNFASGPLDFWVNTVILDADLPAMLHTLALMLLRLQVS
ncbi:hypothetical protein PILCRDRAFT_7241 [Piloderma croceum F 1598]|uniref:Nephrocystin 3-like N-terminal domain-containing protein n=1 Tax=Piloderma croceum (strain F 1598) TaxID=765440 RepID=A0A0C3FYH9_PILCF|nr:hypothetical protein PILCRDRAFT_7241 [Piloderma croceum F 1598]